MPFKIKEWIEMCSRLDEAQLSLERAREDSRLKFLLAQAIWGLWSFGEYAINVALEMEGRQPDQQHGQADQAIRLYQIGILSKDYSLILTQQENYRLKASHSGYAKNRATHYSSRNVQDCLDAMRELQAEIESLLRARGKLPDAL